jgi:Phage capsid family
MKVELRQALSAVKVKSEPLTYTPDSPHSFFRDLVQQHQDRDAAARIRRHQEEMESRDVAGTSGGGAAGVMPPTWLSDEYAPLMRAPRPFADLVPKFPMPPAGVDTVKVPQLSGGATVAVQTTENSAASKTDITSAPLTGNRVVTIAGTEDVSTQSLLRSVPGLDEIIYEDLLAAYNEKISFQLYYGAGSGSGEHVGIDSISGGIGQTYTQATPDQQTCLLNITQAVSKVATQRKLGSGSPIAVICHPRRLAWLAAASGTASLFDQPSFEELGLNVSFVADPNISTVKGASTSEDRIYVCHYPSLRLAEDNVRIEAKDVLSGTITTRLQFIAYSLFIPDRYLKSLCTISGTGLISPSGW